MSISSFGKNALVEIDRRPLKLIRKIDADTWQVEDQLNGAYSQLTMQDLLKRYANGGLTFIDAITSDVDKKKAIEELQRKKIAYMIHNNSMIEKVFKDYSSITKSTN